jgi:hypothetical protein
MAEEDVEVEVAAPEPVEEVEMSVLDALKDVSVLVIDGNESIRHCMSQNFLTLYCLCYNCRSCKKR